MDEVPPAAPVESENVRHQKQVTCNTSQTVLQCDSGPVALNCITVSTEVYSAGGGCDNVVIVRDAHATTPSNAVMPREEECISLASRQKGRSGRADANSDQILLNCSLTKH